MKTMFKTLLMAGLLAFGTAASAVTILPPLVLDFAYSGLNGGTFDGTTVTNEVSGSISIDELTIGGGTGTSTGEYAIANGTLVFDTAADVTEITITGSVFGLVDATLFTGSFVDWSYTAGPIEVFQGSGSGSASLDFLTAIGEADANALAFYGFTMQREYTEGEYVTSTDFIATETGDRTVVPIPAAVWLFGSGLIGLVGVARRKA